MSFLLKSDTLLRELTSLFLTSVTIYKYRTALVLQFLSTKIFQRTLSFIAQEKQLRQEAGVVPVLRVQRYDFS